MGFNDINPQAPIHIVLIPKKKENLDMISHAMEDNIQILGHLMFVVSKIAKIVDGLQEGYRIVVNDGKNGGMKYYIYIYIYKFNILGQEVMYLHLHILGGRQLTWPPG